MIRRVVRDLKKYNAYCLYAVRATLKSEVAGSYLNWLWWFLDPLLFMLVYTFIVQVVFDKRMPNFHIYVFIGLNVWKMFNGSVMASANLIRSSKGLLSKVYVPKFILLNTKIFVALFKMSVAFLLVFVMCAVFSVRLTWNLLYCLPLFLTLYVVTFGLSSIVLHMGVYFRDLSNIMSVLLRLVYYMSGIFFDIQSGVPQPYSDILLHLNPIAFLIHSLRQVVMYQRAPNLPVLLAWFLVGLALAAAGIRLTYRHENSYAKVV